MIEELKDFNVKDRRPNVGELYFAKRNTGWKLLTCNKVDNGFIVPIEKHEYCYDFHECFVVLE